jgi:hypothetical protein
MAWIHLTFESVIGQCGQFCLAYFTFSINLIAKADFSKVLATPFKETFTHYYVGYCQS